jgi:lipid-A-disaccharide synthase
MKKLMFIAGEASGDTHAAAVISALREREPGLTVFGAGGPKMKAAGMELVLDLTEHAVVGLWGVLKNLRSFRRMFLDLVRVAEERRPDAVVLVDYPGFNLRFAKQMKRRGIKVIYYISPQLWAWHASRSKQIERDVSLLLTIFPFEKDWYAEHAPGLHVEFAGNPMAERFAANQKSEIRNPKLVLLLPGSRVEEVQRIFPVMRAVVDTMPADLEFVATAVDEKTAAMMQHPRVRVEIGSAQRWMREAAVAITASGTATMECAFLGCLMVIVYKVNWLTYLVGRSLVTVNWLGMPNVIAGRTIVPEFIQHDAQSERIAAAVGALLRDPEQRATMQHELASVVNSLGGGGASQRAAELILKELAE